METQLDAMLRARQQYLWDRIVHVYGMDHTIKDLVHTWIEEGVVAQRSRQKRWKSSRGAHSNS